jgi:hypothetical protein
MKINKKEIMGDYLQILALTISGIILLWIGYNLFFGPSSPFYPNLFFSKKETFEKGVVGDPQICPLCSLKLVRGDLVKTMAFPSVTGGKDRLMYIRGCYSCIEENLPRICPVCKAALGVNDYLISRMFERSNSRNHVHVVGCNFCKRMGTLAR